ncbi:MAG TPA: hypothetical protein VN702_07705, partial [Acetobacteraceae bacterium]|nr:hypothetical protein [Acetobacteraceae bacterium]
DAAMAEAVGISVSSLQRIRHPRWTFHFTQTSASWLNAVEGFFATLSKRHLPIRRRPSGPINRFLDDHNADSQPFQ